MGSKASLSPPSGNPLLAPPLPPGTSSYQVGEVVAILARHEAAGVAEAGDVLDVGLQPRRVALQDDVDEGGQEVIGGGWLILGDLDGIEDVLAAPGDAGQLVPRHTLRVHLNNVCEEEAVPVRVRQLPHKQQLLVRTWVSAQDAEAEIHSKTVPALAWGRQQ